MQYNIFIQTLVIGSASNAALPSFLAIPLSASIAIIILYAGIRNEYRKSQKGGHNA